MLNMYCTNIANLQSVEVCLFSLSRFFSKHLNDQLWFLLSATTSEILPFSFFNDLNILKFGKLDPDAVEIRPRPNSYVHNFQNGEYDEPIELYIETDEGIVSHLSQIGPRPRSAR